MSGNESFVKDKLTGSAKWLITIMDSMGSFLQSITTLGKGLYGASGVYSAYKVLYLFYSIIFDGCVFLLDIFDILNPTKWIDLVKKLVLEWPGGIGKCLVELAKIGETIPFLLWALGFFYSNEIVTKSLNMVGKSGKKDFLSRVSNPGGSKMKYWTGLDKTIPLRHNVGQNNML